MAQFLLLLRDEGTKFSTLSPEELQKTTARYRAWMEKVRATGQKLRDGEGRVVARRNGSTTVTDGPFVEAREVIGGYFAIEAPSYDEALRLCGDCPHLDFGSIEIREVQKVS